MTIMPAAPLAAVLPENSNDGYVAAAYIVFFAILLIYVAIMALRLSHVERDLRNLRERAEAPQQDEPRPGTAQHDRGPQDATQQDRAQQDGARQAGAQQDATQQAGAQQGKAHDQTRERETV